MQGRVALVGRTREPLVRQSRRKNSDPEIPLLSLRAS